MVLNVIEVPFTLMVGADGLAPKIFTMAVATSARFCPFSVYLAVRVSVTCWSVVGAEVTVTVPELTEA